MAVLIWGVLFSSIGIGYFMYGKSQARILTMVCGVGLMVYPYFVGSALWMVLIGVALTAAPWYWR